jgi:hypothetical protein
MAVKVTEEHKRDIHAAMEQVGGKTAEAAKILGLTTEELSRRIHHHMDLKMRWATAYREVKAPGDAVAIHRPTMPTLSTEEEESKAFEKENRLVSKGLDGIGLTPAARDLALALGALQKRHYQSCLDMLGGGITKQFIEVMAEVQRITDRLNDETDVAAEDPQIQLMLREDRGRLLDCMQKFYDKANAHMLAKAKEQALKESAKGGGKGNKPGFAPLLMKADNVTIHEQPK